MRVLRAQTAHEFQFRLKVDVMRQLQMLHEARRFDVIAMREHEFDVLRRRAQRFAEFLGAQCAVDERHRHRLALRVAERETVALREGGRHLAAAGELVDHLAFGDIDLADLDCFAQLVEFHFHGDRAEADLARERMRVRIAALRRVTHREQKAFVAAREILQARSAARRKGERLARQIARFRRIRRGTFLFDQAFLVEQADDARHGFGFRRSGLIRRRRCIRSRCACRSIVMPPTSPSASNAKSSRRCV